MVARILSGSSIRGLLNYNERKVDSGDATLILANRFAVEVEKLSLRHKLSRFERLTRLNGRAKRNAMHIMLNFDRSDKLSPSNFIEIATAYMTGIGFAEQPYLVYRHYDVSHPHIHIVTTNIQADGSRIDFHNIGKSLSTSIRKQLEVDFRLVIAEGRGKNMDDSALSEKIKALNYGESPTKQAIYNVVAPVIRSYTFSSLAEFNAILQLFNVMADRGSPQSVMYERGGLVYSALDANGNRVGVPVKASQLAGKPTLSRLEKKFSSAAFRKRAFKEPLKKTIDKLWINNTQMSKSSFIKHLSKAGIDMVFRRSSSGHIYGVTFIDHKQKCVLNGSDLGKQYSAKAILERFQQAEQFNSETKYAINQPSEKQAAMHTSQISADFAPGNPKILEMLYEKTATEQPATLKRKRRKKKIQSQSIR